MESQGPGNQYGCHSYPNTGERGVTNLLRIEMGGLMVTLLGPIIKALVKGALKDENQGLKHYCESSFK